MKQRTEENLLAIGGTICLGCLAVGMWVCPAFVPRLMVSALCCVMMAQVWADRNL